MSKFISSPFFFSYLLCLNVFESTARENGEVREKAPVPHESLSESTATNVSVRSKVPSVP